jgi:hypothetical protein
MLAPQSHANQTTRASTPTSNSPQWRWSRIEGVRVGQQAHRDGSLPQRAVVRAGDVKPEEVLE